VAVMSTTTAVFYTFLGGAPIVLGSYGVGPEGIGLYIMFVPAFYIVGNYLTTHLVRRIGEQRVMWLGQTCSLCGLAIMLALALGGVGTPLAVAMPLMFVGLGHGLLMPPTLAGTVGLIPALAGSAAAVAGLMQQMLGAAGGFLVGLVTHENAVNLSSMMLVITVISTSALLWLSRVRPSAPGPVRSTP
jgi:DHA1 family bicyclomycin/chloramphenicol resistance-like MFS transporter